MYCLYNRQFSKQVSIFFSSTFYNYNITVIKYIKWPLIFIFSTLYYDICILIYIWYIMCTILHMQDPIWFFQTYLGLYITDKEFY